MKMYTRRPYGVLLAAILFGFGLTAIHAYAQDAESTEAPTQPPVGNITVESATPAPVIPDVVAEVDGEKIPGKEFERMLNSTKMNMEAQGMPAAISEDMQRKMVNSMIDQRVLSGLAKRAGIEASDADVEEQIKTMKTQLPSEEMFSSALAQMGVSLDEFKGMIKQQITLDKYIESVTKELTLTDQEMKDGYEKLKAQGQLDRPDETFDVSHILVKVDGEDEAKWDEGKKKIDAARERITKGEKFADVAKEVSEDPGSAENGGAYPDTEKGMMVPEFDKAMTETAVGQLSEPFRTQYGWHILTVTGKHAAGTREMEEVKEPLTNYLLRTKRKEAVDKLVTDAKAAMNIKIYYPGEKSDAPAAAETAADAPTMPVAQ